MVFASIFSANLICMLFFRFFVYQNATISDSPGFSPEISSRKNILDFSIMNGFETITRLGGYILLFSILAGCIRYYAPFPLLYQYLLLGFTEITSGLSLISVSGLPYMTRILLSAAATASGGLCILAQTKGVLHHDLSILSLFYFQVYLYIPYSRYSLLSDFLSVKINSFRELSSFHYTKSGQEIFLPLVFSSSIFITDLFLVLSQII